MNFVTALAALTECLSFGEPIDLGEPEGMRLPLRHAPPPCVVPHFLCLPKGERFHVTMRKNISHV